MSDDFFGGVPESIPRKCDVFVFRDGQVFEWPAYLASAEELASWASAEWTPTYVDESDGMSWRLEYWIGERTTRGRVDSDMISVTIGEDAWFTREELDDHLRGLVAQQKQSLDRIERLVAQ